jgi:D-ribose pyranase
MIQTTVLNPLLLELLGRVRHTNRLVIADAMFPSWPGVDEVDLSLVAGVPTVPQVLRAVLSCWTPGAVWMAEEFLAHNGELVRGEFDRALGVSMGCRVWEPHVVLKERIPGATGLIRTGEMRIYTNVVLESR